VVRFVVTAAILLVALLAVAPADGSVRELAWNQVGTSDTTLAGDGSMAAWESSATRITVVGIPGRGLRPLDVAKPRDCPGALAAVGDGYLLVDCGPSGGYHRFAVTRIATRRTHVVTIDARGRDSEPFYSSVGADWMAGFSGGHHSELTTQYVNWRTGQSLFDSDDRFGAHRYLDLSSPTLGAKLCAPFTRRRGPEDAIPTPAYLPFQVAGPWTLQSIDNGHVAVGRCGVRGLRKLATPSALLGAGIVSWPEPTSTPGVYRVNALRLRDGTRFTGTARLTRAVHIAGAVFVASPTGTTGGTIHYAILRARL
jgi:hypothetical protein